MQVDLAVHVVVQALPVLGAVVAWVVSVVLVLALVRLQDRWEDLVRAWALALSARAELPLSVEDRQETVQALVER